jgi:trk system potassium uptake protein TrkH
MILRPFFLYPIRLFSRFFKSLSPPQTVCLGYAGYIFVTLALLCLPIMTESGKAIPFLDHAFIAFSAVSTTGLITVNPATDYSVFGQLVILLAIQVGGLGYMTFGSFVIMASGGRISHTRLQIGRSILSMPDHFDVMTFLRHGLIFTLAVEILGAIALYWAFSRAGIEAPLWAAIFHSISAYCTAGFSIFSNGLENFSHDPAVNLIIATISYLGAIGFIVVTDIYSFAKGRTQRITLTSRIILLATLGGMTVGTVLLYLDSHLAQHPWDTRLWMAFFQAMSAQTTVGFNTIPLGQLSGASVVVLIVLMILGASPSGTGGGLKSTTWSAGLGACWSALRGKKETTFLGSVIPSYRIQAAFGAFVLYLGVFAAACFVLLQVDNHQFEDVMLECASAMGTVGLSRGITAELSDAGKIAIMALMFIGRAGVVSLGLAALSKLPAEDSTPRREEDLVLG